MDVGNNNSTNVLFHKTNVIHLDVERRLDNEINNKNNILLKEMSYAPVNKKRQGTESKSDSPISSKATSKSIPTADLSSPNSTPITSTYSSKLLSAQNQSIESSAKNKATPNDNGIDPPTRTILLLKKPTATPLFLVNKPTLRTGGVPELETTKEIKNNQTNRAYIDQRKKQTIICSEEVDTESYDLSTVSEDEQCRNNIPTKISNKNLGTVHGKYDNKLRIVKYKKKKDSVHRKKKVTATNDKLPILATINTKLSRRGRKTTAIHQQKQDSTRINQLVIETIEKTTENYMSVM